MPNSLDGTELARNVLLDARPVNNTKAQIWEQFAWNAMAAIILDFVPIVIKHCSSPCLSFLLLTLPIKLGMVLKTKLMIKTKLKRIMMKTL
jgi:hypothetical protein